MTEPGEPLAICVFCGARSGTAPRYAGLARETGAAIARRGWRLVYGGGGVGMMGELANGALDAGGSVVGVIPEALLGRELARGGLNRLEVVPTMAARKERMIQIADAFLSLPGGLGTLDEMFEVLTLKQIGLHAKPSGLLDAGHYFAPLLAALAHFRQEGFIAERDLAGMIVDVSVEALLDRIGQACRDRLSSGEI